MGMSTQNWVWGLSPCRPELLQGQFCSKAPVSLPCPFPGPLGFISASPFSAPAPHSTAAALSLPVPDFPMSPSLLSCLSPTGVSPYY